MACGVVTWYTVHGTVWDKVVFVTENFHGNVQFGLSTGQLVVADSSRYLTRGGAALNMKRITGHKVVRPAQAAAVVIPHLHVKYDALQCKGKET